MNLSFSDFVAMYRAKAECSLEEAATELGVSPKTLRARQKDNNPSLDLIVRIANKLEMEVGQIALSVSEARRDQRRRSEETVSTPTSFKETAELAVAAYDEGNFDLSKQLYERCVTIAEHEANPRLIAKAWDGVAVACLTQGRQSEAKSAIERGLMQEGISRATFERLLVNSATASFDAGECIEATAKVEEIIARIGGNPLEVVKSMKFAEQVNLAHAYFIRGRARLDLQHSANSDYQRWSPEAVEADLRYAIAIYTDLAANHRELATTYNAIIDICRGALIEVAVCAGDMSFDAAVDTYTKRLDSVIDLDDIPVSEDLASVAWWCCSAVSLIKHRGGHRDDQDRLLGVFLGKAIDIAERFQQNDEPLWPLWARIFSYETIDMLRPLMTKHAREIVIGLVARYPRFTQHGLRLLDVA